MSEVVAAATQILILDEFMPFSIIKVLVTITKKSPHALDHELDEDFRGQGTNLGIF